MTVTELPYTSIAEALPGHITSMELVHRAGISYRQLDYWCRTGLLNPSLDELDLRTPGSGYSRIFPIHQLHRAATLRWLLDAGISLQTCRLVIDDLLETGSAQLVDALVIHLPDDP